MNDEKIASRKCKKIITILVLLLIISPNILISQKSYEKSKLTESAIQNYRNCLNSGISGIVKSCIYFAGKYKISEFNEDLIELLKKSENEEHCKFIVWSLYQIGDKKYCMQLNEIIANHPSKKVQECCKFLHEIQQFENEFPAMESKSSI